MGQVLTTSNVAVYPAAADPLDPLRLPHPTDQGSGDQWPATVKMAFAPASDLQHAHSFTWNLAHTHYENFSVVSALLPRRLRQDFCNVYAFCRIADDLSDEISDRDQSLRMLERFRQETEAMFAGRATTLVFSALESTVKKYDIPVKPFLDLIDAFEQDQRIDRYQTWDQLRDYCRRSADPVGRLVLYMAGYRDEQRQQLSDFTCTALQLANFWQDVHRDLQDRNRIYLPRETMDQFNITEDQLHAGRCDENYRKCIAFEVARTQALFDQGDALLPLLDETVRPQVSLFGEGGKAILQAIRRQNFDTLTSRPVLSRWQKGQLIFKAMAGRLGQIINPAEGGMSVIASERILDTSLTASRAYCEHLTRTQAKNFYYGLKLLPEPKRSAMFSLYAFMRLVDDIADDENGRTIRQRIEELENWRIHTHNILDGQDPTAQGNGHLADAGRQLWPAFTEMVRDYRMPRSIFDDVIAGQRQDLEPEPFETFDQLHTYCYRVAGIVGLASIYIWGFEGGAETEKLAVDRGVAFQLTNILRDLREDAARGRTYLPLEDLAVMNVTEDDLRSTRGGQHFRDLMQFQIDRAEAYYKKSEPLEERIQRDSRPTLVAMTQIYHRLLKKVAVEPERVLRERVSLSLLSKLMIGWRAARSR